MEQAGQKWTKIVCVKIFKNVREKREKNPYINSLRNV